MPLAATFTFVEPFFDELHLVHAAKAKAILSARVKPDRLDSRGP